MLEVHKTMIYTMSSTVGLRAFAVRWRGLEEEVLMSIRTTCRDKWLDRPQVVEGTSFIALVARNPKASYTT